MNYHDLVYVIESRQSVLCVGLDSDVSKLPSGFAAKPASLADFNKAIIDATAEYAVAYKPNLAFYEAYGLEGWKALEETIGYLRNQYPGHLTIADAKRGDIGNTASQYAKGLLQELGFDACVDYKEHTDYISLSKALKEACPDGIDGHFENVGGMVLDAVMLRANDFSRIAVCGMIAGYNGEPLPMTNPTLILKSRMAIEGFIVSEHMEVWPAALAELGELVASGKLKPRETIAQGLAAAPEAFMGLLKGRNFGKQLVKLV